MTHSESRAAAARMPGWVAGQHRVKKALFRGRCPVHGTPLETTNDPDEEQIYQARCDREGCGFAIQIIRGAAG